MNLVTLIFRFHVNFFWGIHGLEKLGSKLYTYIHSFIHIYIYIYIFYIFLLHYDIIYIYIHIYIYISLDVLGDESFAFHNFQPLKRQEKDPIVGNAKWQANDRKHETKQTFSRKQQKQK